MGDLRHDDVTVIGFGGLGKDIFRGGEGAPKIGAWRRGDLAGVGDAVGGDGRIIFQGDGFELMDGYTRYTVLKRYKQHEVYTYLGTIGHV